MNSSQPKAGLPSHISASLAHASPLVTKPIPHPSNSNTPNNAPNARIALSSKERSTPGGNAAKPSNGSATSNDKSSSGGNVVGSGDKSGSAGVKTASGKSVVSSDGKVVPAPVKAATKAPASKAPSKVAVTKPKTPTKVTKKVTKVTKKTDLSIKYLRTAYKVGVFSSLIGCFSF